MSGTMRRGLAMAAASLAFAAIHGLGTARADEITVLEARVVQLPHDTDARYALARGYFASARFEDAAREFDALLALDAGNPDWLLGRAQTFLAVGQPSDAVRLLARARTLAPHYEDVWQIEAAALEAAGDHVAADALLAAAAQRFPAAQWPQVKRRRLHDARLARSGARLAASASYEALSGPHASWRSGTARFERPFGSASRFALAAAFERRHGEQDEQVSLGFVHRLPRGWVIEAAGDLAPDARLLPEGQLQLEIGRSLAAAVSGSLRYRHARFTDVDVDALSAGTEYGFGLYRAAYTLTATKATAIEPRFAHAVRFARDYGRGSSVSLALARGEEAETVAPGQVLVTRNTSIAIFGTHWRSAAWGLAWSCSWVEQGDLYERFGVRLGFEHRF